MLSELRNYQTRGVTSKLGHPVYFYYFLVLLLGNDLHIDSNNRGFCRVADFNTTHKLFITFGEILAIKERLVT